MKCDDEPWQYIFTELLHPYQIISYFVFFRFIGFLYIYIYIMSRCIVKSMNLKKLKRLIIWNGGSSKVDFVAQ
jgi:hypothetical protein